MLKRFFVVLCVAMMACSCSAIEKLLEPPTQLLAYNGCLDSWAKIRDARGNVLVAFIAAGETKELPITGRAGGNMELTAEIFSRIDGRPLGANTASISVPTESYSFCDSQGCSSGVRKDRGAQLPTWRIDYLSTSLVPNYNCSSGFMQQ